MFTYTRKPQVTDHEPTRIFSPPQSHQSPSNQDWKKITRLSSGQYFYHAENVLYYISKCENELTGSTWSWCVDGNHPQDSYATYKEAKEALFAYLDSLGIIHGITGLQYSILALVRYAKGKPVYFYDDPYKSKGCKVAVKKLVKLGLVETKTCMSTSELKVWVKVT